MVRSLLIQSCQVVTWHYRYCHIDNVQLDHVIVLGLMEDTYDPNNASGLPFGTARLRTQFVLRVWSVSLHWWKYFLPRFLRIQGDVSVAVASVAASLCQLKAPCCALPTTHYTDSCCRVAIESTGNFLYQIGSGHGVVDLTNQTTDFPDYVQGMLYLLSSCTGVVITSMLCSRGNSYFGH